MCAEIMSAENNLGVKKVLAITIAYANMKSNDGNNSGTYYVFAYSTRCNKGNLLRR